jgi:hypothetical protein
MGKWWKVQRRSSSTFIGAGCSMLLRPVVGNRVHSVRRHTFRKDIHAPTQHIDGGLKLIGGRLSGCGRKSLKIRRGGSGIEGRYVRRHRMWAHLLLLLRTTITLGSLGTISIRNSAHDSTTRCSSHARRRRQAPCSCSWRRRWRRSTHFIR